MTYSWLVENFTKDGQSTGLYMLCQVNMTVTADVNAARKFRLQRTAEFRAADMRDARHGDWRAVEHGFDDSKTPNDEVQPRRPASAGSGDVYMATPEESALTADVFKALDLNPEQFLTDSGLVNRGKLRAALWYPHDYLPEGHWMRAADGGRLREPLAPEVVEAAAAEAFGYEGGLQEVNLGDLLHFARVLEQRHGIGA